MAHRFPSSSDYVSCKNYSPLIHFGILALKDIDLLEQTKFDDEEELQDNVKFHTADLTKEEKKKQIIRIRAYARVLQRERQHYKPEHCQSVIYNLQELINT